MLDSALLHEQTEQLLTLTKLNATLQTLFEVQVLLGVYCMFPWKGQQKFC